MSTSMRAQDFIWLSLSAVWSHLAALNRIASLDTASGEARGIAMAHLLVLEHYVASYLGAFSPREVCTLLFLFSRYDHPVPPRLHGLICRHLDRTAQAAPSQQSAFRSTGTAGAAPAQSLPWCSRREAAVPGLARIPQASFDAVELIRGGTQTETASSNSTGSETQPTSAAKQGGAAARLIARGFFRNSAAAAAQPLSAASVLGNRASTSSPGGASATTAAPAVKGSLLSGRLDALLRHHDVLREVTDAGISAVSAQQLALDTAAAMQRRVITGSNIAWALVRQHLFHERALTGLAQELLSLLMPSSVAATPRSASSERPPALAGVADEADPAQSLRLAARAPRLVAGARLVAASALPQEVLLQLVWALARCGVRADPILELAQAVAPPLLYRLPPPLRSSPAGEGVGVDAGAVTAVSDAALHGAHIASSLLKPDAPGSVSGSDNALALAPVVQLNYVQQVSALWCFSALGTNGSNNRSAEQGLDVRVASAVTTLAPNVFAADSLAKVQRTLPVAVRRQLQQAHALLTGGRSNESRTDNAAVPAAAATTSSSLPSVPGLPAKLPNWIWDGVDDKAAVPAEEADTSPAPARARAVRAVQDAFRSLLGLKPVAGLTIEGFRLPLAFLSARLAIDIVMHDAPSAAGAPGSNHSAVSGASERLQPADGVAGSDLAGRGDATRDAVLSARGWQLVTLHFAQWRRLGTPQQRAQLLQALTHNLPERERAIADARARARATAAATASAISSPNPVRAGAAGGASDDAVSSKGKKQQRP